MNVIRTPDSRFKDLDDYPFEPRYVEIDGLRMHYVDEGPPMAAPVLMLHGEPTWSYLYRHMIPGCVAAGNRVIAPDLIGFGKSDKPTAISDYSYQRHVDWMTSFVAALDLRATTLFCQDWGALIGLRVAAEHPERFARIVIGNGALPTADGRTRFPLPNVLAFMAWRTFARYSPVLPAGRIVNAGSIKRLSPGERRAYDAPFPDSEAMAGARAFPRLVPISPRDPAVDANRAAWDALGQWRKPFLTVFSDRDPIMRGGQRIFQRHVPGAAGLAHTTPHAGHFLQEDAGPELAQSINNLIESTGDTEPQDASRPSDAKKTDAAAAADAPVA
jgi:haloalkane dehalogenase